MNRSNWVKSRDRSTVEGSPLTGGKSFHPISRASASDKETVKQTGEKKIVIACKDDDARDTLSLALREHGFSTYSTESSINALEITLRSLPDLLIICFSLDVISSEKFVQIIRTNPKTVSIPIICLDTGNLDASSGISGIDAYLKEPVCSGELIPRVTRILGLTPDDGKDMESLPTEIPPPKEQTETPEMEMEYEAARGEEAPSIAEDFLNSAYTDGRELFEGSAQLDRLDEIGDEPILEPEIEPQAIDERRSDAGIKEPEEAPEWSPPEDQPPRKFGLEMEREMTALYHTIESLLPNNDSKVIQFTGLTAGDGASTIARQFAMLSAFKLQKTVLLMDADFSRPCQLQFFDMVPPCSIEDVMKNGNSMEKAICQPLDAPLFVTQAARESASVRHTFHEKELEQVFALLKERFELIIIDSSPASASPENLIFSGSSDGIIVVVGAENTPMRQAAKGKDSITKEGGNILGIVFNKNRSGSINGSFVESR